ncbi:MAG: ECF transporter S component [Candidatus Ventricola sp.]
MASRDSSMFTLTRCGLLSAMAVILYYIEIPVVAFYKLDVSTLPAILAGFAMGPIQGMAVIVIKNLVHMLGTSTACVGELADILMSGAFVATASLFYRKRKTRRGALAAMLLGIAAMTAAGVLVNYYILIPAYQTLMNLPLEAIIGMGQAAVPAVDSALKLVLLITAPFNVLKGGVLSALTYLLYKRVSPLLHSGC